MSSSLWQEAFDEASQCTYYYHIETGETSWTLPWTPDAEEDAQDLSFMVFAVVRLQSRLRGFRDRRRVIRLLRAQYQTSRDPVTEQTLYTNRRTGASSWTPPGLAQRLGIDLGASGDDDGDDDDDDDVDFDGLLDNEENQDNNVEDDGDEDGPDAGDDDDSHSGGNGRLTKKKTRKFPRSAAQQRVDAAEDDVAGAQTLDLSGLQAWKLTARIWNIATLRTLSLANNQLTRIPSGIQDLTHLEHLDLSHNQLTRIPSCLQTTATLTFLDASHNRIASFSPKIWKLRALKQLHLGWNALLEMPFIEGDLKLLRDTREWQVGVGLLTQLEVLDLSHNRLSESPKSIEKCASLAVLDLSFNRLTTLSDEICELETLKELRVGHNALSSLPDGIGSLSKLTNLAVDTNRLTALPESVGNLQELVDFDLRENQIHHLPEEIGALGHLQVLSLDGNTSLASLAMCLRFLPCVTSFTAPKCGLVAFDSIDFLCRAPVTRLCLSDNSLLDFPVDIRRCAMKTTLQELDLARNSLHTFPMEVVDAPCVALVRLDLSYNRLRAVPSAISSLRSLRVLVLSHNLLGPTLPESIAWLPQLIELKCDHNKLTRLPLAIGILKKLQHIDSAFNTITTLPTSIVDLSVSLRSLVVNNNQLITRPAVIDLLSPSCFIDLSNNPFCADADGEVATRDAQPQHLYAAARKRFHEKDLDEAEALVTMAIDLLEREDAVALWRLRKQLLPQQLLLRALTRFMKLKHAREVIDETSLCIDECERELSGTALLRLRAAQRRTKTPVSPTKSSTPFTKNGDNQEKPVEMEGVRTETVSGSTTEMRTISPSTDSGPVSNQTEDLTIADHHERLQDALRRRSEARERAAAAASGALEDLDHAIPHLPKPDLVTAYSVQGHLFTQTLQFPQAIDRYSRALDCVVAVPSINETTPTPLTSVAILMARAQAYRRLGQLPSALADLRLIISTRPMDTPEGVTNAEEVLAREWDVMQSQYFVDHDSLFRGFDVASQSGLARRPEVHNVHAILTPAQKQELRLKRPSERFDASVQKLRDEIERDAEDQRTAMQAQYDKKVLVLKRARDFKREVRENLAMEMEEATQRMVEAELARLAELKRQELDREFNERMFMKYEDEYMRWLVSEEQRLEAERLRREEDARRKAEAKAQYEMRLARRGGRRQQLASRGTPPRKASVTSTRSSSPPKNTK